MRSSKQLFKLKGVEFKLYAYLIMLDVDVIYINKKDRQEMARDMDMEITSFYIAFSRLLRKGLITKISANEYEIGLD